MSNYPRIGLSLIVALLFCWSPEYGQTTPASSGIKVLRSVSGSAGHQDAGRYIMEDPRSVFEAGKHSKVIVYFEWEGPLGPHHFEGLWKGPEGKIVLISDFSYEAKGPRFNGYWSMLLSDATPTGEWNLEARIDGQPAGVHSFVITGPSGAASAAAPRVLDSADLYQRAIDGSVTIEKIAADGTAFAKNTAFWVGDGRLLTAFDAINGATALRIRLRDGSQTSADQVIAWNRWQDWALVKAEGSAKAILKPGSKDPLKVGDRCVFLDLLPAGAKLVDGSITGRNAFPKAGERLLLASGVTSASFGGPLLDEYGNYVGIVGGNIIPGSDPTKILSLLSDAGPGRATSSEITGLALPSTLLPDFASTPSPVHLADLANHGEFLDPVVENKSLQSASLGGALTKDSRGGVPTPADYRRVFSHRDNKATVYVTWRPSAKMKLHSVLRWFDSDNKLVSESKARELSLSPGNWAATVWEIPVNNMPAGIYRIDLLLNEKTAWRDFFRITE